MMKIFLIVLSVSTIFVAACAPGCRSPQNAEPPKARSGGDVVSTMIISSTAFDIGAEIPEKYTCEGEDISVPLTWSGVPPSAKSLALIVDDPDAPDPEAPKMVWVHWVLYNIPVSAAGLVQGVKELPIETGEGSNDWNRTGYGGPCPPIGRHRYFHKLYALDTVLPDLGSPTKDELLAAMKGHIVAQAELMGTYEKKK